MAGRRASSLQSCLLIIVEQVKNYFYTRRAAAAARRRRRRQLMPLPRCRTTMMLASLALDLALAVAAQPATNFVLLLGE
jgi:hypothetical protein